MRVVILNQDPRLSFYQILHNFPGSASLNAPFFFKRQYIQEVTKKILFFPWRSPSLTYCPLNVAKYPKKSLISKVGFFGGKGRTPGETWPKRQEWPNLSSSRALGTQLHLLRRKPGFKSQNFQIWPLFDVILQWGVSLCKITSNKGNNWKFWVLKPDFLLNK